jgi:glycine oxidase
MALMPSKSPKIIVIGAGPIGLYTSMVLASVGCHVSLVDDGKRGAGWASGGMLGAAYEVMGADHMPADFKTFAFSSQWLWGQFLRSMDVPIVPSSLFLARSGDEVTHLAGLVTALKALDMPLTTCAVPFGLNAKQAWLAQHDIAFDPRQMLGVLRGECQRAGVSFVQSRATHIETGGVWLDDESTLAADQIIVTSGYAGRTLAHCVPDLRHMAPVKGQMLALAGTDVVLEHVVRAGCIYLLPRGDHVVVGATSQPDDAEAHKIDADLLSELLTEATALCPALARGHMVESWAGLRPMTPDGLPLLGLSRLDGVILATGTYRNGWLLAAGLANHVMGLVLDDLGTAANLQCLSPLRFPI